MGLSATEAVSENHLDERVGRETCSLSVVRSFSATFLISVSMSHDDAVRILLFHLCYLVC